VLQPVFTRHTMVERVNADRLLANAVEAAECCHRLTIPEVREPMPLDRLLANWPAARRLVLCDESGAGRPIAAALADLPPAPGAVLIGPEGGFAREEFESLAAHPSVIRVALGPRLMRADTAALAALAAYQAVAGDWRVAGLRMPIMQL
jgi:16S rRNA (uracil1498-N3)-methyltransferase